jgi:hypothetical protein
MQPQRAKVASLEALESFRSALVIYLSKARPALEESTSDVFRLRSWLETEQRTRLEGEMRKRMRALEMAQQALFSARISILQQETSAEQLLYHRARRAVDEAEEKLRILKKWTRDYDNRVQPLLKQTEKLHRVLSVDMQNAVAELTRVIETLSAYAEIHQTPAAAPGGAPPAPSTSA